VVFFCQNNQWAISVPFSQQTASETIAAKAGAYGMPGVRVDGNDVMAVFRETAEAVARARAGEGPTLIEALTYRRGGHSSSDDPTRYRASAEEKAWEAKDPLARARQALEKEGLWTEADEKRLQDEVTAEVAAAVAEAEKASPPALSTLFEDVYAAKPPHLLVQEKTLLELQGETNKGDGAFPL
jgi:TPP-dependent pyruvate/acetoin dehydrogenase alpha subunit